MSTYTVHRYAGAAVAVLVACASNLTAVAPAVADVNIGALACQPPYLAQAQNLRWHEHYVVNPLNAPMGGTPQTTWVVCPISFDSNDLPQTFQIGAFGNATVPGTNAKCYANVVDLRNQHIPDGNFLDNPGQNMTFQKIMATKTPTNTLWSAWLTVTQAQIKAAMMDPPSTPVNPAAEEGTPFWTITINCELKPGQAINMVSLWPTHVYALAP